MLETQTVRSRLIVRIVVTLVTLAVVIVPTVMRSRQRIQLRDTTRLSIRLNWQSDAPPQKDPLDSNPRDYVTTVVTMVTDPEPQRVSRGESVTEEPAGQTPVDNAPDLFRGPPSLFI